MKIRVAVVLMSLLSGHAVFGDDILVPADFSSIQGAVKVANDGDRILVSPGVYYESVSIVEKTIEIVGVDGAESTTLNASLLGGSAMVIENSTVSIEGIAIKNGQAVNGGGMNSVESYVSLTECIVTNNSASSKGGGLFVDGGSLSMHEVSIDTNDTDGAGGGIYIRYSTSCVINNSTLNGNLASNGGAIYFKDLDGDIEVGDSELINNMADNNGGAIYIKNSSLNVSGTSFESNSANRGGAIATYLSGNVVMQGGIFQSNGASDVGGAADIRSSTCSFTLTSFDSNVADNDCDGSGEGGAINNSNSSVTVTDIVLCANMGCDDLDDFSGDNVIVEGETGGCDVSAGACCGGSACWIMEEIECIEGGGTFLGGGSVCVSDSCVASVEVGSCCISPVCVMTTESGCDDAGGEYGGELVECSEVICESTCAADINQDGSVDVDDLILVISYWGACP